MFVAYLEIGNNFQALFDFLQKFKLYSRLTYYHQ